VFGKNYVVEGYTGSMFLSRASVTQISQIEKVFDNPVENDSLRYYSILTFG
jgi:hypothetical protein